MSTDVFGSPETLKAQDVVKAYEKIEKHIHRTPVLTSRTLDKIASTPRSPNTQAPRLRLHFKCENFQKIGAFKARGAFHALKCLVDAQGIDNIRSRGVVTHSSGNHAQALAFAAHELGIPAHIVMPSTATSSKVAGTRLYTDKVVFCEPTTKSREETAAAIIEQTGAILVPPYNHVNILLGQGTCALELAQQVSAQGCERLNLVISPLGGGGLLSGVATYFSEQPETYVFGAEPSFQGGDDGKRGFEAQPAQRIETVHTMTIADGLRTPVGPIPWSILTSGTVQKAKKLQGIRAVTEQQIKDAMRLLLERVKIFVEPSACVGLAALLYDEDFRAWIASQQQKDEAWDVGVILSGGNTTIEALTAMFNAGQELKQ